MIAAFDNGNPSQTATVQLLIESGVNKTLLGEVDWEKIKAEAGNHKPNLTKNKTNFKPVGINIKPLMQGRTKCRLTAACGKYLDTMVYVVEGKDGPYWD